MNIFARLKTQWQTNRPAFYEAFLLAAIVLFGGLLRCYSYAQKPTICRDAIQYLKQVENWPNITYTLPLYQGILFRMTQLGISAYSAALWLGMICGIMIPVPVYFLLRQFDDKKLSAFIAATLVAMHPGFVRVSYEMIRDMPFLLLVATGWMFWAIAIKRGSRWAAMASGIFLGMSIWMRYEGVEALLVALVASCVLPSENALRRALGKNLLGLIAGIVCAILIAILICALPFHYYRLFIWTFYYRFL